MTAPTALPEPFVGEPQHCARRDCGMVDQYPFDLCGIDVGTAPHDQIGAAVFDEHADCLPSRSPMSSVCNMPAAQRALRGFGAAPIAEKRACRRRPTRRREPRAHRSRLRRLRVSLSFIVDDDEIDWCDAAVPLQPRAAARRGIRG